MKLEDIGFYTLSNDRVKQVSMNSPYWRCELILTNRCNFKCPYCRGLKEECKDDLSLDYCKKIVNYWCDNNLKNIRFSGGEPTLYSGLKELVKLAKDRGVERIALSTNGSAKLEYYRELHELGVNDFSISLDACCADFGKKMCGNIEGMWYKVVDNIKELSKLTYVTVGIVLTEQNINQVKDIVEYAHNLGVSDIRVISSAQFNENIQSLKDIPDEILEAHPILKYRATNYKNGRDIRGLSEKDNSKCPLVVDDMAVSGKYHFPCIIYMREQGNPIGTTDNLDKVREERYNWFKSTNVYEDPICRKNCLDVCIDMNNKHMEFGLRD